MGRTRSGAGGSGGPAQHAGGRDNGEEERDGKCVERARGAAAAQEPRLSAMEFKRRRETERQRRRQEQQQQRVNEAERKASSPAPAADNGDGGGDHIFQTFGAGVGASAGASNTNAGAGAGAAEAAGADERAAAASRSTFDQMHESLSHIDTLFLEPSAGVAAGAPAATPARGEGADEDGHGLASEPQQHRHQWQSGDSLPRDFSLKSHARLDMHVATQQQAIALLAAVRAPCIACATPRAAGGCGGARAPSAPRADAPAAPMATAAAAATALSRALLYYRHPAAPLPACIAQRWQAYTQPLSCFGGGGGGAPQQQHYHLPLQRSSTRALIGLDGPPAHDAQYDAASAVTPRDTHGGNRVLLPPGAESAAAAAAGGVDDEQAFVFRRIRDWHQALVSLYGAYRRRHNDHHAQHDDHHHDDDDEAAHGAGVRYFYMLGHNYAALFAHHRCCRRGEQRDRRRACDHDGVPFAQLSRSSKALRKMLDECGAHARMPLAPPTRKRRNSGHGGDIGAASRSTTTSSSSSSCSFASVDGKPESMLHFSGAADVHVLYEFMLTHGPRLSQALDVPLLVTDGAPFLGSAVQQLPVRVARCVAHSTAAAAADAAGARVEIALDGPLMPDALERLARAMAMEHRRHRRYGGGDCDGGRIALGTDARTVVFGDDAACASRIEDGIAAERHERSDGTRDAPPSYAASCVMRSVQVLPDLGGFAVTTSMPARHSVNAAADRT